MHKLLPILSLVLAMSRTVAAEGAVSPLEKATLPCIDINNATAFALMVCGK
jgi:hypothetical protein